MEKQIKTNRLIAEFMGYEVVPYNGNKNVLIYNGNKYAKTVGEQKALWSGLDLQFTGRFTEKVNYPFDIDFNYLLPVIRKIEEQGYVVAIKGISYQVYKVMDENNPIVSLVCGDLSKKTEMTCDLIVSFIENQAKN
ncbi:MAG: hypothetical protein IT243_05035 [Bacteroidia bacterium]|nr:hypothetical protein [Bacteroidia bacterium]